MNHFFLHTRKKNNNENFKLKFFSYLSIKNTYEKEKKLMKVPLSQIDSQCS